MEVRGISQNFAPCSFLSPAKTLVPSAPLTGQSDGTLTKAEALDVATSIVASLKTWSQEELAQRMKLSPALAEKVHRWHQDWQPDSACAAGWTFKGDAFKSLDLTSASAEVVQRAQSRLRICLLYTSPSPRDMRRSRMPSSA